MLKSDDRTVSLVLGSGGARGLAHIGVIRWLEERGYEIKSISGCSIGSLVGGMYAIGKLAEFEEWVRAVTRLDIFTFLDLSMQKGGFFKGDKVIDALKGLVGDTLIENLPIPYTAVATDIKNEREVWINKGSLFDAIRASISLPLFLTPFELNGVKLIDGGVLNPVPIAPTFMDDTDITIAVNLGAATEPPKKPEPPIAEDVKQPSVFQSRIGGFIDDIKDKATSYFSPDWNIFDVANQSFDAMQSTIARQKLAAYPPDVTIDISRYACGTLEFDKAEEMIEMGRNAAEKSMVISGRENEAG